ncbi:hypothetical protein AUJ14_03590 [Candidatus Micrarchaeota archaeon CG1_02_55_22]|nr:MAG: hypothetical protein AUJ14_03590 [Candidatus Micrarchaeota archaeon CG1_02_55_22]
MALLEALLFLVLLIVLSGVFSGTEAALLSVSKIRARALVQEKRWGAKALLDLKDNQSRAIITVLIGNNLVNIAASVLATIIATQVYQSLGIDAATGLGVATGIMTLVVLVFGEVLPKTIATAHSTSFALAMAKPLRFLQKLLWPVVWFLEKFSRWMLSLLGSTQSSPLVTEEDIKSMLQAGVEEHVLEKNEQNLMLAALDFNDTPVWEVMVPRARMVTLPRSMTVAAALRSAPKSRYSRFPIYGVSRDDIVGVVHIKDLIRAHAEDGGKRHVDAIMRRPLFVSREQRVSGLFKDFQKRRMHLAIVVDEFGGVEGLVTLEDLFEELVGDIADENELNPDIWVRVDKNTIVAHGDTEVDTVNDYFKVKIPKSAENLTISGLLHQKLKRIPVVGDAVHSGPVNFRVEEASHNQVTKVRVWVEPIEPVKPGVRSVVKTNALIG